MISLQGMADFLANTCIYRQCRQLSAMSNASWMLQILDLVLINKTEKQISNKKK